MRRYGGRLAAIVARSEAQLEAMDEQRQRKMVNSYTECKVIMADYIDNSPNLPEHIKPQAKQHIFRLLNLMPEYLGHLELLWRREKDNQSHQPTPKVGG